jgi:RimJ/RimL family protein N-acetyltransferase
MKMMSVLKEQPGIYRISTFVDVENIASQKVLLNSGLVEEARLEKWFRFINQNNQPKNCILYNLPL